MRTHIEGSYFLHWWLREVGKKMAPLNRNKTSVIHFRTCELSKQLMQPLLKLLTMNLALWAMKAFLVALSSVIWLEHKSFNQQIFSLYTLFRPKIIEASISFLLPWQCLWPSNLSSTACFSQILDEICPLTWELFHCDHLMSFLYPSLSKYWLWDFHFLIIRFYFFISFSSSLK